MIQYQLGRTYRAVIETVTLTQIGEKKTDCIVFGIRILGLVNNATKALEPCESHGREIVKYLSDKAQEYTVKDLINLGYEHNDLSHLNELVGKEPDVYCKAREYKDKDGNPGVGEEWNFSQPGGGGRKKHEPLDEGGQMKLNALIGKTFQNARGSQVNTPKAKQAQAIADAKIDAEVEQVF